MHRYEIITLDESSSQKQERERDPDGKFNLSSKKKLWIERNIKDE